MNPQQSRTKVNNRFPNIPRTRYGFGYERPFLFTNVRGLSHHVPASQNTRPNLHSRRLPRVSQTEFIENVIKQQRFVLLILRGPSGSGKTTLANRLKTPVGIICNTDEYFVDRNGMYNFQGSRLEEAHVWNQQNAIRAMESKLSPVIIDNTNCFPWEMLPYVRAGQNHGYEIFFLVPDTPWALNAKECAKRNIHGIKEEKIDAFIRNFKLDVRLRDFDPSNAIKKPPDRREQPKNELKSLLFSENSIELEKTSEQDVESQRNSISGSSSVDLWNYRENSELWNMNDDASVVSEQIASLEVPNTEEYQLLASDATKKSASESNIVQKAHIAKSHYKKRHHHKTPADLAAHNVLLNNIKNQKSNISTANSLLFDGSTLPEMLSNNRWTLSNDLILGSNLTPGSSFDEDSDSNDPCPTLEFETFEVSNKCFQVTESAIGVTYLKYSRLEVDFSPDKSSILDHVEELCLKENYFELKRPLNSGKILQCDKSSQTVFEEIAVKIELTDNESVREVVESTETRENDCTTTIESAIDTLRILFPNVPGDDLRHILDNCAQDPEWASNVLLESGYEMTFSKKNDQNSDNEAQDEKNATIEKSNVPSNSADSICCTVELSIDMASQLQELFGRVHNDLPAELLNPRQLKIDLPLDLAGKLFQHWLKTQSSPEYTDPNRMRDDEIYDFDDQTFLHEDRVLSQYDRTLRDQKYAEKLVDDERIKLKQTVNAQSNHLSTKLKLNLLTEMFRELDKETLTELFKINDFNLQSTVEILCDTLNISPNEKQKLLSSIQTPKIEQPAELPTTSSDHETDDFEDLSYENLRSKSLLHYEERKKFFDQAQQAYRKKMPGAASYYAQIGRMHDAKLKDANAMAAKKLMNFRTRHDPPDTIDLHGLHVQEAVSALSQKLKEFENRSGKQVNIITGSGKHSFFGAAKIKPAVIAYLARKKMTFFENNSGLIQVTIK